MQQIEEVSKIWRGEVSSSVFGAPCLSFFWWCVRGILVWELQAQCLVEVCFSPLKFRSLGGSCRCMCVSCLSSEISVGGWYCVAGASLGFELRLWWSKFSVDWRGKGALNFGALKSFNSEFFGGSCRSKFLVLSSNFGGISPILKPWFRWCKVLVLNSDFCDVRSNY